MARFKKGDVIKVDKHWDHTNNKNLNGITLVTEVGPITKTFTEGVYEMKKLSGNINWTAYNAKHFDNENHIYLLGNIYDDPAIGILYGK